MISVSADNEKILDDVVRLGHYQSRDEALADALKLLRDNKNGHADASQESVEEWTRSFDKWMNATPHGSLDASFDRETIYEGRD